MKNVIIAALLGLSLVAPAAVSANADTFQVHGFSGTHYGR